MWDINKFLIVFILFLVLCGCQNKQQLRSLKTTCSIIQPKEPASQPKDCLQLNTEQNKPSVACEIMIQEFCKWINVNHSPNQGLINRRNDELKTAGCSNKPVCKK